jgi:hypothetical protein
MIASLLFSRKQVNDSKGDHPHPNFPVDEVKAHGVRSYRVGPKRPLIYLMGGELTTAQGAGMKGYGMTASGAKRSFA